LLQPVMRPVFDTQAFGDILISSARSAGKDNLIGDARTFEDVLKARWRQYHQDWGVSGSFDKFWMAAVEAGGYIEKSAADEKVKVAVNPKAFQMTFGMPSFAQTESPSPHDPILLPYASVKSFDGRSANRAWLQELPDPITQAVWDTWVEMHPDMARAHGIEKGDLVTLRNFFGEINVPVYITEYIHPAVVGVPVGNGHSEYGRFASGVGDNVKRLLPAKLDKLSGTLALLSTKVSVLRGRGKGGLVSTAGSDSQQGRELARTTFVDGKTNGKHHGGHAGHHEPKQMYVQRKHPLYNWGMTVDLAACTGCSACVVACYSENNIPMVGKKVVSQGREMSWIRIERYHDGTADSPQVSFLPLMCQHCNSAPCEPVCPVYATYHNEEGLNVMVYNRCVGTRYCSNNCPYKVRRFNWLESKHPEPLNWQLNPDVTPRVAGVMEKCTFCVQRIQKAKDKAKDMGRLVEDGEVQPACVQSCPTQALTFGNLDDDGSRVSKNRKDHRAYQLLDHHLNTQPSVSYLENKRYKI
ncbi:MAG: 4Fe-4S dicluster domain-containing protein, partial [Bdellovibrionales bacterium]|nr:4Fe-4S dicluster domain-containing protein [Bdellovibrionales bacterium]